MTAAQVVRPSTRKKSTRSTRESNAGTKDAHRVANPKRERPSRPSTRGSQATGTEGVQKPRRKVSTRNGSAGVPDRPSTRVRTSTRPAPTRTKKETVKQTDRFSVKDFVFDNIIKRPEKPEEESSLPKSRPSRAEVYGQKREVKRNTAPLQFLVAMFFVVVFSVLAFGLLRGDPVAQQPDGQDTPGNEVILERPGTTSTNTGILRGSGQ